MFWSPNHSHLKQAFWFVSLQVTGICHAEGLKAVDGSVSCKISRHVSADNKDCSSLHHKHKHHSNPGGVTGRTSLLEFLKNLVLSLLEASESIWCVCFFSHHRVAMKTVLSNSGILKIHWCCFAFKKNLTNKKYRAVACWLRWLRSVVSMIPVGKPR